MDAGLTVLGVRTAAGTRTVTAGALDELRGARAYPTGLYDVRDTLNTLADRVTRQGAPYRSDRIRFFAAAAAVEGLRVAIPRIADHLDRPAPADPRWRTVPGRHVELDLDRYRVNDPVPLGQVDLVSGGAITNAALYTLLRMPSVRAWTRVIEPEVLDLSNLNRYALTRRSMISWPKTRALETYSTNAIHVSGVQARLDQDSLPRLEPLAPRVLVGVDDIPRLLPCAGLALQATRFDEQVSARSGLLSLLNASAVSRLQHDQICADRSIAQLTSDLPSCTLHPKPTQTEPTEPTEPTT